MHGSGRPTARLDCFRLQGGRWSVEGAFIGDDNAACVLTQG
jgi:hypothetical protein